MPKINPRLFAYSLSLMLSGIVTAHAAEPTAVAIPDQLKAAPTAHFAFDAAATGVQIYVCGADKADAHKFVWNFKAPQADLFDAAGKQIGTHYAGPTWESTDGSKVVGQVKANSPVANAIPWLLLDAKSNSGKGVFGTVSAIQRLSTEAGKAPADGCTEADAGKEVRVPYKALYRFYTPN